MSKVNVAIPTDTYEKLKALKRESDIPMAKLIVRAVELLIKQRKEQLGL